VISFNTFFDIKLQVQIPVLIDTEVRVNWGGKLEFKYKGKKDLSPLNKSEKKLYIILL